MSVQSDLFRILCNDVLFIVFKYLDVEDLDSLSLSCRRFHSMLRETDFWKTKFFDKFPFLDRSFKGVFSDYRKEYIIFNDKKRLVKVIKDMTNTFKSRQEEFKKTFEGERMKDFDLNPIDLVDLKYHSVKDFYVEKIEYLLGYIELYYTKSEHNPDLWIVGGNLFHGNLIRTFYNYFNLQVKYMKNNSYTKREITFEDTKKYFRKLRLCLESIQKYRSADTSISTSDFVRLPSWYLSCVKGDELLFISNYTGELQKNQKIIDEIGEFYKIPFEIVKRNLEEIDQVGEHGVTIEMFLKFCLFKILCKKEEAKTSQEDLKKVFDVILEELDDLDPVGYYGHICDRLQRIKDVLTGIGPLGGDEFDFYEFDSFVFFIKSFYQKEVIHEFNSPRDDFEDL